MKRKERKEAKRGQRKFSQQMENQIYSDVSVREDKGKRGRKRIGRRLDRYTLILNVKE